MKITVFFTYGYSLKTWYDSGTIERELEIYKKINEKYQVNFTFVTYGNEEDLKYDTNIKNSEVVPIYSLIKYNNNSVLRYLNSFKIPYKIRMITRNSDILHQHQLLGSWIPIICKLFSNKPLLIRTGYDMYQFSLQEKKGYIIKFLYKFLTNISLFICDIYTVTSNSDRNLFKSSEKVRLRPNWVYQSASESLLGRFENRILSVGRLADQKNYEYLINEFRNTKGEIVLDIYGSGERFEYLNNLAKESNVDLNIHKNVKHDDLLNIYKKYKFFISTSLFEGNPKTILEAMSLGCVVLASNIPNHSEIIINENNGYLYEIKENNLLTLYSKIKNQDEKLNNISENAKKDILNSNSLEVLTEKMYSDYTDLIK